MLVGQRHFEGSSTHNHPHVVHFITSWWTTVVPESARTVIGSLVMCKRQICRASVAVKRFVTPFVKKGSGFRRTIMAVAGRVGLSQKLIFYVFFLLLT